MNNINRRAFISSLLAATVIPSIARAQENNIIDESSNPIILNDRTSSSNPTYVKYASNGQFIPRNQPTRMSFAGGDYWIFSATNYSIAKLIVFSHNALTDPLTYRELIWHWVSHGYIVVCPVHSDSIIDMGPTIRKKRSDGVSEWPISSLLEDPVAWKSRANACSAVIDNIKFIEDRVNIKIDHNKPCIIGNGYGAYIAQMLCGATVNDSRGMPVYFYNPEFKSGIFLSPQGPGVMGLHDKSWENLKVPAAYIVAEYEKDFTNLPNKEKRKSYDLSAAGYKHLAMLKGGNANSFTGQNAKTNAIERIIFEVLKAYTTCFLDAYVNYNDEAFQTMQQNFFNRMSLGVILEEIR